MKIDNIIEAGEDYKPTPFSIDQSFVGNYEEGNIRALTQNYIFSNGKPLKVLDGSVQADIVVNAEDREALNTECDETKKLLNEEREARREIYYRQARVLYPDKEEWCLSLAIDAFIEQEEKGIDITKYKFEKDAEKY